MIAAGFAGLCKADKYLLQDWVLEAAACLVYDSRFLHLPTPNKGIKLRVKLFPEANKHTLVLYPPVTQPPEGMERARRRQLQEQSPRTSAIWVGAQTEHKVDFLLERLKYLTYSTVNTVLLSPRVWRMAFGVTGCTGAHPQH